MTQTEDMMPMVKVTRMTPVRLKSSAIKAYVDVVIGRHFAVRDLRIMEGSKGLFVSMPSRKIDDGSYMELCHPVTKEARELINSVVKLAYSVEEKKAVMEAAR